MCSTALQSSEEFLHLYKFCLYWHPDVNELPNGVESIVPHGVIPVYCEGMFPKRLETVFDFMHIYDEDMTTFGDKIEWLPEPDARLANELTVR